MGCSAAGGCGVGVDHGEEGSRRPSGTHAGNEGARYRTQLDVMGSGGRSRRAVGTLSQGEQQHEAQGTWDCREPIVSMEPMATVTERRHHRAGAAVVEHRPCGCDRKEPETDETANGGGSGSADEDSTGRGDEAHHHHVTLRDRRHILEIEQHPPLRPCQAEDDRRCREQESDRNQ